MLKGNHTRGSIRFSQRWAGRAPTPLGAGEWVEAFGLKKHAQLNGARGWVAASDGPKPVVVFSIGPTAIHSIPT